MLWSMARLRGYGLSARDGEIGQVVTVCFDEAEWLVRGLVVDTGRWLLGRQVAISPHALGAVDRDRREIQVHLSRDQVRHADPADIPDCPTVKELAGCALRCDDMRLGHVEDVLIDDDGWRLRYAVIDTGTWLPGRKLPLPAEWISRVDWAERELVTGLTAETLRDAPDYTDEFAIDRAYEERLYAHYGRVI